MNDSVVRARLKTETFRKYKVFCAMANLSVTEQTARLIAKFIEESEKNVKIIKILAKKE